jgi:hypothetical protein
MLLYTSLDGYVLQVPKEKVAPLAIFAAALFFLTSKVARVNMRATTSSSVLFSRILKLSKNTYNFISLFYTGKNKLCLEVLLYNC